MKTSTTKALLTVAAAVAVASMMSAGMAIAGEPIQFDMGGQNHQGQSYEVASVDLSSDLYSSPSFVPDEPVARDAPQNNDEYFKDYELGESWYLY